jgi:hypothetical protein
VFSFIRAVGVCDETDGEVLGRRRRTLATLFPEK